MIPGNVDIKYIRDHTHYHPFPYGKRAGEPTVQLRLSKSDSNEAMLSTIEKKWASYGWKSKLRSGFARLRLKGANPLDDEHLEMYQAFEQLMDPRFLDVELTDEEVNQEPSRTLDNMADSFSFFMTGNEDFDPDVFQTFAERSRNYGDCEFIFKVKVWGDEDYIKKMSRKYQIYDSDIWLYPVGEQVNTLAENHEKCVDMATRNTWNVSPRFDVIEDYEEED
jgi:hypothetical protein